MRMLIVTALVCVAGCAGQPPAQPSDTAATTASATSGQARSQPKKEKKIIPERIKGPYKVVMRGDEKLYCTKELATGSHVNHRTICLTPEEYLAIEQGAKDWKDSMQSIVPPGGPSGTEPGAR